MDPLENGSEPGRGREWRLGGVIFFSLLAIAILYAAGLIIWPFLSAIIIAVVLVTVTFPLYERVRTKLKGRSTAAAIVMLLGITFVLILPAAIVCMLLVQQASTLAQHLQSADARQIIARIDFADRLQFLRRFLPGFDPASVSPQRVILPVLSNVPRWIATHGAALLGGVVGVVLGFGLVLLAAFYFYVEGETIVNELAILSPLPARYDREFAHRFKDVIDATFRGQLMTSLAQAIATGVGLAICGVPGALLWSFVAMVLSLLPMLGAATVWVPAAAYLWIAASMGTRPYWPAIVLTFWGIIVISTIDNIVRPWAMKGKAQLPAIPLLFAVLGGMQAFGFVGLVLGPLVFSLLMAVVDIYKNSFRLPRSESNVA
ncbi:MAG TPA: AI-2E family transporter [Thermoanaerobaculia bacterium]|nr:AI-2E family transporter [Thermoanaerobaculia bacterium]